MSDWCILRTSSRSTLPLAQSLAEDGFDVWTPIETKNVRVPKMNARREVKLAIMPSYIFARASHLIDLLQLERMPVKPRRGAGLLKPAHDRFRVLQAFGRIPMVADRHLAELRKIEAKRTPIKRAAYSFPKDASARVNGGSFQGLVGVVVRSTPKSTVLRFDRGFPVELPTTLLDIPEMSERKAA